MPSIDRLVALVAIFFILSSIIERIVELFKLNMPLLRDRQIDQKERELEITKISAIIGFVVAILFRADLFAMISSPNPADTLGWSNIGKYDHWFHANTASSYFFMSLRIILGSVCTGLLLMQGTRYWHDTLDIVLQLRNYTRALSKIKTLRVSSADQLQQQIISGQIADSADGASFEHVHKALLDPSTRSQLDLPGVHGVSPGFMVRGGERTWTRGIVCYVNKKMTVEDLKLTKSELLPRTIKYKNGDGKEIIVEVDVVETGNFVYCTSDLAVSRLADDVSSKKRSGGSICSSLNPGNAGTITCVAVDAYPRSGVSPCLLLTAGHTVLGSWSRYKESDASVTIHCPAKCYVESSPSLGQLVRARRDGVIDAGVARVGMEFLDPKIADPDIWIKSVYSLDESNWSGLDVRFTGHKSGTMRGRIIGYSSSNYVFIGENYNGLILTNITGQLGDSGALLIDQDNRAIGILIAISEIDSISVFLPIDRVEKELGIFVVTQEMQRRWK